MAAIGEHSNNANNFKWLRINGSPSVGSNWSSLLDVSDIESDIDARKKPMTVRFRSAAIKNNLPKWI
jgi:hypothetical protein